MNRTLAIIKPDGVRKNVVGAIIDKIQKSGFRILAFKMHRLTKETAGEFYAIHKQRPFYGELVEFMSSGPCVPIVLEKSHAVTEFRNLIGATDPVEATEGTIRKLFATSKGENVIHGSDSDENAKNEIHFFFSDEEIIKIHVK